jgi:hypothetical protein
MWRRSLSRVLLGVHPWAGVAALMIISVGVRGWAARQVPVPWIAPDEMVYGLLGRSLYESGKLAILGSPAPFYSALVPLFVGGPLSLGDLWFGYGLLQVLQAAVMSLAALPVYLWARSLAGPRWALVAATLTLAAPALIYSGLVMSEVLFYPIFVLAAWAMAKTLESPSRLNQSLLIVAITAALATRLQAIVLLPAFATAVGLDAVFGRSTRTLRRLAPAAISLLLLIGGWLAWRTATGEGVLGGYGVVTDGSYDVGRAARFVLYHGGDVVLLTGVFPVCALLLLLIAALRQPEADAKSRAYLAVTSSLSVWLVFEVGVFASRYVGQLAERDLIGLAPLLFIGFVLWLRRGGPRGYWTMSFAGVATAGLVVALPLKKLVTSYAPPDAPSVMPLYNLLTASSLATLELVFFAAVAVAITVFAVVPRPALIALPIILMAALTASSIAASRYVADQSRRRQQTFLGPDPRWIDHAGGKKVAYLFQTGDDWVGVWETVFWNRSVERVYDLGAANVFGPMPQQQLVLHPDGHLTQRDGRPVVADYVVSTSGVVASEPALAYAGQPIAKTIQPGSQHTGLVLWRIDPPLRLRLAFRLAGLKPNGDIYPGGNGRITAYTCDKAVFRITLLIKQPQTVTILRNGKLYRQLRFRSPQPNQPWRGVIPAQPRPGQGTCTLDVHPDGLIGTTIFQAEPSSAKAHN